MIGETGKLIDAISELDAKVATLESALTTSKAENKRLKEFARHVIEVECWDIDGADIQKVAQELGLIVPYEATKEDIDKGYEVGDPMFKFSETLKGP